MLDQLLSSPAIALLLLGFLFIEAVILWLVWKFKAVGLPPMQIIAFLGAGACFAIALGLVMAGYSPQWLGLALIAAFCFHALDIYLRWLP
jgi:hypothetical protein